MTADDQVRAARKIADDAAADVLAGLAVGRVAAVLAAHERSGVSSVNEGRGDDERAVGYHAWCYCAGAPDDLEGAAQWRGTFKVPAETAGAELRAHVAAAIVAALDPP